MTTQELLARARQARGAMALADTQTKDRALLAMAEELDNVKQSVADVARLIAAGQFEQALQLPFPSLDPVGHMKAITNALKEIPRLAAKLPGQWLSLIHI